MTIEELANLILDQTRERLAREASQWQADAEQVEIIDGKKYTRIDRGRAGGMSGFLMIEKATGRIYGIKGYGRVHTGHYYGTLDTAGEWYWGEYSPGKVAREPAAVSAPAPAADEVPAGLDWDRMTERQFDRDAADVQLGLFAVDAAGRVGILLDA